MKKEMKKTYIQPLARIVWYGLDENFMQNIGGMDATSGCGDGPDENWVKEERDWNEGAEVTISVEDANVWEKMW